MDIFQVIEALKPQNHVVTMQVVNSPKDIYDWLIAFSPTLVAIVALIYSAKQFKLGIRAQINQTKLNARIETEGRQRQEWCNTVRILTSKCVAYSSGYADKHSESDYYYQICTNDNVPMDINKYDTLGKDAADFYTKFLESRSLLLTYLDPEKHTQLFDELVVLADKTFNKSDDSGALGYSSGLVLKYCREIIEYEQKIISDMHKDLIQ